MPDAPTCKTCGAPLSDAGVAGGLCGRCLVRFAIDAGDETRAASATLPPDRIGPYRLVEKIAEGGMGVVFRAEQQSPVRRTVAIKLIRPGFDSAPILARFDAERQAMALMDHPGIARIHDAGATEDGRPYFVMEYVPGEPVTTYCDRRKLGTKDRIGLFLAICDAVQHAHHKGVVHRDLKPSNVLVTEKDGKPAIKVIDFGIAKATQQKLTDRTLVTQIGLAVGTPEYMSPEQASGNGLDVDTRTDVYSLGELLYELLVGALPFDPEVLRRAAIEEVLRTIREVDPPRPSARLQTLGDASTTSASLRSTEPGTLEREIRGDLDWIAMKALEKDRNRRYGSPAELAADLRRHLDDQPVLAGPPSAVYRARKFVRRHRVGVTIATATAAALVAGMIGTTYGLVRATRAEKQAREHAATAERVSDFLVGLFEVNDPSEARGKSITAREVLDKGVRKIEAELKDEPEIRARLLGTLGKVHSGLGLTSDAIRFLETAWEHDLRLARLPDTPVSESLAWAYVLAGRYADAERVHLATIERARKDGAPRALAMATAALGNVRRIQGQYVDSERLLREGAAMCERSLGPESNYTLAAQVNLAATLLNLDRAAEATVIMEDVSPTFDRLRGADDPRALIVRRILANCYWKGARLDEAIAVMEDVLEHQRRIVGPNHPIVQETFNELGLVNEEAGRLVEAERRYREAISMDAHATKQREAYFSALNGLARLVCRRGACSEAESLLRREIAAVSDEMRRHPRVAEARIELARVLLMERKDREALDPPRENLESLRGGTGEWNRRVVGQSHRILGRIHARLGEHDRAIAELREAVAAGYREENLAADPDFAALAEDPEFQAIAAEARTKAP